MHAYLCVCVPNHGLWALAVCVCVCGYVRLPLLALFSFFFFWSFGVTSLKRKQGRKRPCKPWICRAFPPGRACAWRTRNRGCTSAAKTTSFAYYSILFSPFFFPFSLSFCTCMCLCVCVCVHSPQGHTESSSRCCDSLSHPLTSKGNPYKSASYLSPFATRYASKASPHDELPCFQRRDQAGTLLSTLLFRSFQRTNRIDNRRHLSLHISKDPLQYRRSGRHRLLSGCRLSLSLVRHNF